MDMKNVAVAVALAMLVVACSPDSDAPATETTTSLAESTTSTTQAPPPQPVLVFTVETSGGCLMAGPNCAAYRFFSDGSVELLRLDVETRIPEATGSIDPSLVAAVSDALAEVDLADLHASLPPGECRGCYDGIDTTFIYEVPGQPNTFASVEVELTDSVPLFAATWSALAEAELTLGQLEPEMRGEG